MKVSLGGSGTRLQLCKSKRQCLQVQKFQMNSITALKIWVSPSPISVLTDQTILIDWQNIIRRFLPSSQNFGATRVHSSWMRTAHLLTVSQHALRRGVSAWGGWGCLPRGVCPGGCLPLVWGGVYPSMQWARPPRGQTDTCENITLANFVCGR